MRLISIKPSTRPGKKLVALFDNDGRSKTVHFGASGMDDYTKTGDKEQRERYRTRHAKDLETGDPTRAGFLPASQHSQLQETVSSVKKLTARRPPEPVLT